MNTGAFAIPEGHRPAVRERRSSPPRGSAARSIPPARGRRIFFPGWFFLILGPLAACGLAHRPAANPPEPYRQLVEHVEAELRRVETVSCGRGDWTCLERIIVTRHRLDQMVRDPSFVRGNCLGRLGFADGGGCHMGHMIRVDESNRRFVEAFIAENDSPFCSPLPSSAQQKFWYLVQHLDDDPDAVSLRTRLSGSLLCALRKGSLSPWQYAAFVDRLRLMQDRPQLYGTQVACTPSGVRLLPAVPTDEIRANRERVGMRETIAQTLHRAGRNCR